MRRRSRVLATARRLATLRVASFGTRNRGFVFPGISETTADSRAGADAVRGDDWRVRTADASARSRDPRRSRPTTSRARGSPRSAAHRPPRASADRRSPPSPPHPRGVFLFRTDASSGNENENENENETPNATQVYSEGTHLMVPWFERPITYDVRARAHQVSSTSGSKDLQMVNISLRVLTRPDASKLPEVYRTLGTDFNERVLPSIIHETLKSVVAQYNASQLLTQREQVSLAVRDTLVRRAAHFNMIMDDVSITALTFGREYTAAIEAKQVAQQEAERAKFIVEKAVQDKRSAVIKAEGEAKSAKLIGEAIANNPAFITLRKIEAAREIAQTMSESNNRVMLNADSLLLNLADVGHGKDGKK
jgi:prohibitin 2